MADIIDDGSLACLHIPRDEKNRSFNCDETTQSKLVNTQFWVVDFIEDVPTRFSKAKGTKGQTLVKIKMKEDSPDSEARKFLQGRRIFCISVRNFVKWESSQDWLRCVETVTDIGLNKTDTGW